MLMVLLKYMLLIRFAVQSPICLPFYKLFLKYKSPSYDGYTPRENEKKKRLDDSAELAELVKSMQTKKKKE